MASSRDLFVKTVTGLHEAVFRVSKGKLLSRGAGMPVLLLTTKGRKSGQPRTTMLTTPLQLGDTLVLVASNGGDDRHPQWFLNLRDNPGVEITMHGATRAMTARVADPAEKAELWPQIIAEHGHYGGYQRKTNRDIPLVVLEP